MRLKISKKGFTLAEVLLTLTIVGIIASMTIPELVSNIRDQQLKTAWKKSYNSFSSAIAQLMNDNGGSMIGVNEGLSPRGLRDKLQPYLNVVKSCGYLTTLGECWHTSDTIKLLNGNLTNLSDQNEAGFVLADGTLVQFGWIADGTCNANWGSGQTIRWCNRISFDVNGFKGPNMVGKDVFSVYILKDRVVPEGVQGDQGENDPVSTCPDDGVSFANYCYPGAGCAAKYLMK